MLPGRLNIGFVAITVAIGGFLLGFDATVISGVVPFIREYFALSGVTGVMEGSGFAVSKPGMGCNRGQCNRGGALSDRFGRRRVLLGTALLFVLSSLLAALREHVSQVS